MVGYIGLGSNEGDREEHLREGLRALVRAGVGVEALSSLWETEPVGGAGPGLFLNMAARIRTEREPEELMSLLLAIELTRGREREDAVRPRPLDLDLLLLGDVDHATSRLTLPHPRMWERRFVLAPLAEIAPELVRRGTDRTVAQELEALADSHAVRRLRALDWAEAPPVYSAAP